MPRFNIGDLINFLRFNAVTPPDIPQIPGFIRWNEQDETIEVVLTNGSDPVVMQVGQEQHILVRNNTGSDIPNGSAVACGGSLSFRPTVTLAQANAIATCNVIGITTQAILNNSEGFVTTFGLVRDFDTQTPGWNEGDILYLSPTVAGGLQNTPPISGFNIPVGRVLRQHPTDGMIFVNVRPTPAWGDLAGGNYTQFDFDGTMQAIGAATTYRDELQPLIGQRLESPGSNITIIIAEGSLNFDNLADPTDYVVMNSQINHDWVLGTQVEPHVHWWQAQAAIPNWLIQYRWQIQGSLKTTAWTSLPWTSNAFTYPGAGTLNQITGFGNITPPVGYGEVSDIIQFRLIRDNPNTSGLFAGADPVAGSVQAINFDMHIEVDMLGSRARYTK